MGVDAGTRYVLTIGSGGTACQVTGLSQDYGGPDWTGPVRTVPFRLDAVTGQGVMLRCGGQDVLLPAALSVRWGGTGSTAAQPNVSVVTATEPRLPQHPAGPGRGAATAAVTRPAEGPGQAVRHHRTIGSY